MPYLKGRKQTLREKFKSKRKGKIEKEKRVGVKKIKILTNESYVFQGQVPSQSLGGRGQTSGPAIFSITSDEDLERLSRGGERASTSRRGSRNR